MTAPPRIVYWKWNDGDLDPDALRSGVDDLCSRSGFDLVLAAVTDADVALDDPRFVEAVRIAVDALGERGRRLAVCIDPRDEKERSLDRGLPTLRLVDSAEVRLDGSTWRSEVDECFHRFGKHRPEGDGLLGLFVADATTSMSVEARGVRAGPGWVEVDLPDAGGAEAVVFVSYRTIVPDVFSPEVFALQESLLDGLAGIDLGGVMLDEWGTVPHPRFDFSRAYARPWFSPALATAYETATGTALVDDLPRIRTTASAAAAYHRVVRERCAAFERLTYDTTKRHWGADAFVGAHPTWWGLDDDHQAYELWKNGLDWWDVPRDHAQTDEHVAMGVRLSLARHAGRLPWWNMWYSADPLAYYRDAWASAPFGGRTHYLGYRVAGMAEPGVLEACWSIEERLAPLDGFLQSMPLVPVLLVGGEEAIVSPGANVGPDGCWRFGTDGLAGMLRTLRAVWAAGWQAEFQPSWAPVVADYRLVIRLDGTEDPAATVARVAAALGPPDRLGGGCRYEDGSVIVTAPAITAPTGNRFRSRFTAAGRDFEIDAVDFVAVAADGTVVTPTTGG